MVRFGARLGKVVALEPLIYSGLLYYDKMEYLLNPEIFWAVPGQLPWRQRKYSINI